MRLGLVELFGETDLDMKVSNGEIGEKKVEMRCLV